MDQIQIEGRIPLRGELKVQGSKNSALPIMAASVLHRGLTVIENCPHILDVEYMGEILRQLGCRVWWEGSVLLIDAKQIRDGIVLSGYATKLRASALLMGSLLGRCGEISIPYPGGCTIGKRPIDLHLKALSKMGAEVLPLEEGLWLRTRGLQGTMVEFPFPSVGATENAILAAVLADGVTILKGCAAEPEIEELCRFLCRRGANISGIGSARLTILGVKHLEDCRYRLMPDRIAAGTYLCAAAGCGGRITLWDVRWDHIKSLLGILSSIGTRITVSPDRIVLEAPNTYLPVKYLVTAPYPGFPTDLQSQMMTLLCCAKGTSRIRENLFEHRFQIVGELGKMGADIQIRENCAVIQGVEKLRGRDVEAKELRGGAALVSAGLMAEGRTVLSGTEYIRRGYEDIVGDYSQLGAKIRIIQRSK